MRTNEVVVERTGVPGLTLATGVLDEAECAELVRLCQRDGRAKHFSGLTLTPFGHDYDFTSRASRRVGNGELPGWLTGLLPRLSTAGWSGRPSDRVLATRYPEHIGGLGKHIDAPAFGDVVAGLTLEGGDWPIVFTRGNERFLIPLPVGSVYVFSGEARQKWYHEVPRTGGKGPRTSLTFRTGGREPRRRSRVSFR